DECYGIDDLDNTVSMKAQELLANDKFDSFLLKGLEKSINQSNLESCKSLGNKSDDASYLEKPIWHIDSLNTPYAVAHETSKPDGVKNKHLYSASANEIDEKKPELKRFFQILIAHKDQEKTTFTYTYGIFAYRRMPFGLCNAPASFQRCMMEIFHDMVNDFMEVFMNDFSVFGNSFDCCLANLIECLLDVKKPTL
nr:RNA-directed DNA polymerase homolog [Tanacetum cinerariifolium]